ncbi:autophagy protein 5 [Mortierella sp. 14UC]|nr:autophagy protein 5 [Mortierella sp. 14UC]
MSPSTHQHSSGKNTVARIIWEGSIPIQFIWDPAEAQGHALEPFFVEVPRCSYLSLIASQIRQHFAGKRLNFSPDESEIWFDYKGTPLKWYAFIDIFYKGGSIILSFDIAYGITNNNDEDF